MRNYNKLMYLFVIILFFIGLTISLEANDFNPTYNPVLEVNKTSNLIKIDGQLNYLEWGKTSTAYNFVEHYPGDQTKPPVETKAYITYDEDNLYVAFLCYDDPLKIRASMSERDKKISNEDYVRFCLDTYSDAAWAYIFTVNPYGVQSDEIWASSGGEDIGFDLIWESAAQITDSGYQVEIAIPFTSLRFSTEDNNYWKADFFRNHPRQTQSEYSWAAYDRDENCWPCQWGILKGISGVKPGRGIEIAPAIVGFQSGSLISSKDNLIPNNFYNNDPEGELSLWTKYGLSSNTTIEMTINPDFSQIEADAGQIDINTTYAIFYPERRPFFQEGSDIFRTPIRTLYTRAINDPEFAIKATTRSGGTNFGYLFAKDKHSIIYLPSEESNFRLETYDNISNILKLKQAINDGSQIGLTVTDHRFKNNWSNFTVTGDGRFRFTPSFSALYQIGISNVTEPNDIGLSEDIPNPDSLWDNKHTRAFDGESFWGSQSIASIRYWSGIWNASITYQDASPTFHDYIALIRQNHYRNIGSVIGYFIRPKSGLFETINPHIRLEKEWNWDGKEKYKKYELCLWTRFRKAQASFYSQYISKKENFGGYQYDNIKYLYQDVSLSIGNPITFSAAVTYGNRIARRYHVLGKILDLSLSMDFKINDRILLQQWFDYAKANQISNKDELYKGYIWRTRINYQISKPLAARLITEYDDFSESLRLDPLLTYRLNPFSVFYIGMTSSYQRITRDRINEINSYSTRLVSRQFFIKLQYLFRV